MSPDTVAVGPIGREPGPGTPGSLALISPFLGSGALVSASLCNLTPLPLSPQALILNSSLLYGTGMAARRNHATGPPWFWPCGRKKAFPREGDTCRRPESCVFQSFCSLRPMRPSIQLPHGTAAPSQSLPALGHLPECCHLSHLRPQLSQVTPSSNT